MAVLCVSPNTIVGGFLGALIYGIVLSVAFVKGYEQLSALMAPALLIIALFFPIYRPQHFLGFVFGLTLTFGAFFPTGFGVVVGLVAFVIYNYLPPFRCTFSTGYAVTESLSKSASRCTPGVALTPERRRHTEIASRC